MRPHPHAAQMLKYANDAAETCEPWTRWLVRTAEDAKSNYSWMPCTGPIMWHTTYVYLRKPEVRTVVAALTGLAEHVRACPAYPNLRGDMDYVDQAIQILNSTIREGER